MFFHEYISKNLSFGEEDREILSTSRNKATGNFFFFKIVFIFRFIRLKKKRFYREN